jgi:hypothetical protein
LSNPAIPRRLIESDRGRGFIVAFAWVYHYCFAISVGGWKKNPLWQELQVF